jgi:hypothetical protein
MDVGIKSADEIRLIPVDEDSQVISEDIQNIIDKEG